MRRENSAQQPVIPARLISLKDAMDQMAKWAGWVKPVTLKEFISLNKLISHEYSVIVSLKIRFKLSSSFFYFWKSWV